MIRFIEIGNQIECDGETKRFAWWDTVKERFLVYYNEQSWETWNDFAITHFADWVEYAEEDRSLERFWQLYPEYRKKREKKVKFIPRIRQKKSDR